MCRAQEPGVGLADAHGVELADILRQFAEELSGLTAHQERAVHDIIRCRTAELGGHVYECDHCGHRDIFYNSCRNRHCPKCQSLEQARWLEARQADLLPVEYYHVVFTVPALLRSVFLSRQRTCYALLFAAAAETLREVALSPARLGAKIGLTAVLHTWTQTLEFHPHIHCIVPGGGLDRRASRWVACKPGFFLPVRVLSKVFRGKVLSKLESAVRRGDVETPRRLPTTWLQQAARKQWIVYSKAPFAGPKQVLAYLGAYTHRIAISNQRLIATEGRKVTFRYKDRADDNRQKLLTLDGAEFVRRFLMHVVPKGLMRIRHYGLLANCIRRKSIALCRELLADGGVRDEVDPPARQETWQDLLLRLTGVDVTLCPACEIGHLVCVATMSSTGPAWSTPGRATSP